MLMVSHMGQKTQELPSSRLDSVHFTVTFHRGSMTIHSVYLFIIQYNLNLLDLYLIKMMCDYTNPAHFLTDEPQII